MGNNHKIKHATMSKKFIATESSSAVILIRLMVGVVFLSEGVQKFLFPETIGAGRFTQIGIPYPGFSAPFAGSFEIICGLLLIGGLYTRIAAIPLLIVILTAISTTKIPIFIHKGFWAAMHEGRTDYCMFMGLIFLLIMGSGKWSLDHRMSYWKSRII
jgi:putative oxidoreductase